VKLLLQKRKWLNQGREQFPRERFQAYGEILRPKTKK
jgi:hypothetical protein